MSPIEIDGVWCGNGAVHPVPGSYQVAAAEWQEWASLPQVPDEPP